jgi:hypothetical protein
VIAYKFLADDGSSVFSRFRWPLPNGGPGDWVEAEVDPCRSGVHACRLVDLPFWIAPALYEAELDGDVVVHSLKVVAPRGRLVRRIDDWNADTREEYSQMCIARAGELAASAPEGVADWAPAPDMSVAGPALMGFVAARIAEQLGGTGAYMEERMRQSAWLADRLHLE